MRVKTSPDAQTGAMCSSGKLTHRPKDVSCILDIASENLLRLVFPVTHAAHEALGS